MKHSGKAILLFAILMISSHAKACLPGLLKLNSVDALSADGLIGSKGLMVTVEDMKQETVRKGVATYTMTDNKTGKETHNVVFLGSVDDKDGVIQTSYLVKDLETNVEQVAILKSNYMGGGVRARSVGGEDTRKQTSSRYESLVVVGCQR